MSLADVIGRWIGKVEIVLAGADEDLREGEEALASGDAMRARAAAHRVLGRAPDSPIGLALLADACEAAHLDAELALTLEELARRAPSRAEVWVRLARARQATGGGVEEVRDALVQALAVAEPGSDARRDALLLLADADLRQGDGERAELWLERAADERSPEVARRRAEARLLRGDAVGAAKLLAGVELAATDGHAALVHGRALALLGDPACFGPLVRAMVLDVPGASEALSSALSHLPTDLQVRARVRSVVDAKGEQELARWRAAFARAEGARDAARRALREAVEAGDRAAARALVDAAVDDQDRDALAVALGVLSPQNDDSLLGDARKLTSGDLEELAGIAHPRVVPWADRLAAEVVSTWIPPSGAPADWPSVMERLDKHARRLADLESVAAVAELAVERSRPVRLAIVGEFNAGKSTFINALIGADVAPTGVLPTTATLHHLRWAPDAIARIFFAPGHEPPERIVALSELRATLSRLDPTSLAHVELLMPLPFLVRVEILDTPGFNAPDPQHTTVARSAFERADAAIWLLDATQALKQSEREVLEEARRVRLPVQLLVNKADRLKPGDLARVMESVDAALVETGIESWTRPLALSAKRALAGKLGDAGALEESGWRAVQALLDDRIVARSEELKERALRRRAERVVAKLASQASEAAEAAREDVEAKTARAHAVGQAAAAVERRIDVVAEQLARSLQPAAEDWKRDLALVFVGRDPDAAARDPVLSRYRVERALALVAPPLAHGLSVLAPEAGLSASALSPTARVLVRAAAATSPPTPEALLLPLARAAVATLVEQLFALSATPEPQTTMPGVLRELRALSRAMMALPRDVPIRPPVSGADPRLP